MSIEGDSKDYHIITNAIKVIPSTLFGMTCEIGLRRGGGTGYIIPALSVSKLPCKVHIGVDCYGDIAYPNRDGVDPSLFGYTNQMRDQTIGLLHEHAYRNQVNFIFMNMDDSTFFDKFSMGVPVYDNGKKDVIYHYVFAHIDGPHQTPYVMTEFLWFNERMQPGATLVFDDVKHYDHDYVEREIFANGWQLLQASDRKKSYQKVK